jgi:nickel/cobalt transporter (NicO) family protein
VVLLISAIGLGFLHGLGGDHLMAIAALSVDGHAAERPAAVRRAEALGIAARFALGHALLLGLGAGAIVMIGWSIPPHVERGGEMLGGGLLILMGLMTLQQPLARAARRRAGRHAAHADHRTHPAHAIPHTHATHLPTMIGAAFAISSLRALAMLTPFGDHVAAAPLTQLLALIAVFAIGILSSMLLFGVALAGLLSTRALERVGHAAGALVGVSSIVLGVAWVATA